jgi:hypothetical protein
MTVREAQRASRTGYLAWYTEGGGLLCGKVDGDVLPESYIYTRDDFRLSDLDR